MYIEIDSAIEWTVRLTAVCVLVGTFEKFWNVAEYRIDGIFSWEWLKYYKGFKSRHAAIRQAADIIFRFRVWMLLLAARGAAAVVLLVWPGRTWWHLFLLSVLFVVCSFENFRRLPFFSETPNRFVLLIIGALIMQVLVPSHLVITACLWFIAVQSCVSYATAGIGKLFNGDWRTGDAIFHAANASHFVASPVFARFFERYRPVGQVLSYTTVGFEVLFPLALVIGPPFFWLFLIWGFAMHLTNAVVLRLNNYFWAWIASYPAIIYVSQ